MSILKFKNADGTWNGIAAFKGENGKDGAIQYKAGYGINISEDNTISATLDPSAGITVDTNPTEGSVNPVSSGGVYNALSNKANKTDIPTDLGDFTNGPGYITEEKEEDFNNSVAASITAADISNWNSKQPAGNYITPDYLTANIISDLVKVHSYTSSFSSADTGSYTSAPVCEEAATLINNIYNSGRKGLISIVYSDGVSDIINNLVSVNTTLTSYNLVSPRYNTFIRIVGSWNSEVFTCTAASKYKLLDNYYLAKTNTTAYTPTSDYHPATKLYVDNKVSEGLAGSGFLSEEADPIFTNHVASTITENDITNWNNKADEGGITEELDPTVPTWVKSITENDILKWNNKADSSTISGVVEGILSDKGYITEETEPAFNASVAANITQDDIDSWNAKQNALSISDKYNGASNPIATIKDIPTDYIKQVNASKVIQDNNALINEAQTKLTNLYTQLKTNAVVNGTVDYSKLIGNFDIRFNETSTLNGAPSKYYSSLIGQITAIQHCDEKEFYATALIGTTGYYDTKIIFESHLAGLDIRPSYAEITINQFTLYVNEANILNGVEGTYALARTRQSVKLTRYQ